MPGLLLLSSKGDARQGRRGARGACAGRGAVVAVAGAVRGGRVGAWRAAGAGRSVWHAGARSRRQRSKGVGEKKPGQSKGGTGRRRAPPSHGRAEAWQGRGGARGWRGGTRGGASGSPVATPRACDRSRRSSRGPRPRPVGSGEGGTGRRLSGIAARPGSTAWSGPGGSRPAGSTLPTSRRWRSMPTGNSRRRRRRRLRPRTRHQVRASHTAAGRQLSRMTASDAWLHS